MNETTARFKDVERGGEDFALNIAVHRQQAEPADNSINAACLGWGLTRVLSYQVADKVSKGELEIVLQDFEQPPLPIHVVYQGGRKIAAKVRTFVDFCAQRLAQDPALNSPQQA